MDQRGNLKTNNVDPFPRAKRRAYAAEDLRRSFETGESTFVSADGEKQRFVRLFIDRAEVQNGFARSRHFQPKPRRQRPTIPFFPKVIENEIFHSVAIRRPTANQR